MKKNRLVILLLLVIISQKITAQTEEEKWIVLSSDESKTVSVNVKGLSIFQGDEIYVWVQEDYVKPMEMEEISAGIAKAKFYYMINKALKRYSLVDVIYYDSGNNAIKNFHYNHDQDKPEYKYTSPIMNNSDMELILSKCLEIIEGKANN